MAGSYKHILHGASLIENMRDAREVIEELFWLVESEIGRTAAKRLLDAKFYPMIRGEKRADKAFTFVAKKMVQ